MPVTVPGHRRRGRERHHPESCDLGNERDREHCGSRSTEESHEFVPFHRFFGDGRTVDTADL
jgi:hypothetical protein